MLSNGTDLKGLLRSEYDRNGLDNMSTDDVLKLILSFSKKSNEIEKCYNSLIARFGSAGSVFSATHEALISCEAVDESTAIFLKLLPQLSEKYLSASFDTNSVMDLLAQKELIESQYLFTENEVLKLVCLDKSNKVISVKTVSVGDSSSVSFDSKWILNEAISCGAKSCILGHNHPQSYCFPSASDINSTAILTRALKSVGINFVNHLIIGNGRVWSMRHRGIILDSGKILSVTNKHANAIINGTLTFEELIENS